MQVSEFNALVQKYCDFVDFVTIYVMEAHPSDSLWPDNDDFDVKNHAVLEERLEAARTLEDVGLSGRLLVDSMQDLCSVLYGAVPERLLIAQKGIITYIGDMGPMGYSIEAVDQRLSKLKN